MTDAATRTRAAAGLLAATLLASCSSAQADPAPALSGCAPDRLSTHAPGRLTLSTGPRTRPPWVVGAEDGRTPDPRRGEGYDAATGYALADRLGYARDAVTWVATPFEQVLAPGAKAFDVNVNQVTITPERRSSVDLSTPYLEVPQAVVTLSSRAATPPATLAVVQGSPGERAAAGHGRVTAYPDLDTVRRAVGEGTQDALVTDLATAIGLDEDDQRLVDGQLVGLLAPGEGAEAYGLVLAKGSPLTDCVDRALAAMRSDGELDRLQQRWLSEATGWERLD